MPSLLTTLALILLTLLAVAAAAVALLQLRVPEGQRRVTRLQHALAWVCASGCAAVFLYQVLAVNRVWRPLTAHVDGLVLIAALLAGTVLFVQNRPRLQGLAAFGLPLLALILAWAICASSFTYRLFHLDTLHPVWTTLHLACVYTGTLFAAVAAAAGGTYLYVQRRLRVKHDLKGLERFGSLESIELLIVRCAGLGFVLLTMGLVTGLVIETGGETRLGPGWWHSPKIVLATLAWLVYALLMNVRFATSFRGARAAWLSIAGLVLLLATYGVVNAIEAEDVEEAPRITRAESQISSLKSQVSNHKFQTSSQGQGRNSEKAEAALKPPAEPKRFDIAPLAFGTCLRFVICDLRFGAIVPDLPAPQEAS